MGVQERRNVFISYAHRDGAALAQRLRDDLNARGLSVWLDTDRLSGAAVWTTAIERALDAAQVVLALMTHGSYVSDICRAEQLRSLRTGKYVIPVIAQAGAEVPLHLETRVYRNFARADAYPVEFSRLLDDIHTGTQPVMLRDLFAATTVTAPPLPRNHIERPGALSKLREALLTDEPGPSIALTALRGMGGIGKTILAQALCHDQAVREAFPDGIVWTTVGNEPAYPLLVRMQEVRRALGNEPTDRESEQQCINRYRTALRSKAALIVVDDVWRVADIAPFLADSPRSRVLFTTRDQSIAAATGATEQSADLLTRAESHRLLSQWSGLAPEQWPAEATPILDECRELPLAISMVGAMLRGRPPAYWQHVLALLQSSDLRKIHADFPGYPHTDLLRVIKVSVDVLGDSDRARYLALAVLLEEMPAAPEVQQILWNCDRAEALETAERFVSLSLASRDATHEGIRLHDLQLDYVRTLFDDREALGLIHDALQLSWHVVENDPTQFASQLTGRLLPHRQRQSVARFMEEFARSVHVPWLRPIWPTLRPASETNHRERDERSASATAGPTWKRKSPATSIDRASASMRLDWGDRWPPGPADWITRVALSVDRKRAALGSLDGPIRIWDLDTRRVRHTLTGHTEGISGVALVSDGRRAVSASLDGTIRLWNLDDLDKTRIIQNGHTGGILDLWVSADGREAISTGRDAMLKLWDLESGEVTDVFDGPSARSPDVAVTEDLRLAASADQHMLTVWDIQTKCEVGTFSCPASIELAAVRSSGQRAVAMSNDGDMRVWDLERGHRVHAIACPPRGLRLTVSADATRAVVSYADGDLRVWDLDTAASLGTFTCDGFASCCEFVDPRTILSADLTGRPFLLAIEDTPRP